MYYSWFCNFQQSEVKDQDHDQTTCRCGQKDEAYVLTAASYWVLSLLSSFVVVVAALFTVADVSHSGVQPSMHDSSRNDSFFVLVSRWLSSTKCAEQMMWLRRWSGTAGWWLGRSQLALGRGVTWMTRHVMLRVTCITLALPSFPMFHQLMKPVSIGCIWELLATEIGQNSTTSIVPTSNRLLW